MRAGDKETVRQRKKVSDKKTVRYRNKKTKKQRAKMECFDKDSSSYRDSDLTNMEIRIGIEVMVKMKTVIDT